MEFTDDDIMKSTKKSKTAWTEKAKPEHKDEEYDYPVHTEDKDDYDHLRVTEDYEFTYSDIHDHEEYPSAWVNDISETMTSYSRTSDFMKNKVETSTDLGKKKKITIPTPFTFDQRESTRPKSINKKRFQQYVADLNAKEEAHISFKFKANPIPASTLEPR
jgi:hypothetical protein